MAHIIVVGNEKGGAGKSTVSMHVATALARMGHKTSVLDLDLRQRTFGRYVDNRKSFLASAELDLPSPEIETRLHHKLDAVQAFGRGDASGARRLIDDNVASLEGVLRAAPESEAFD